MKKKLFFIGVSFFCLLTFNLYASQEFKVESQISEVTIYPDSALILRTSSLRLKRGNYKVIFDDIIPEIDENSLRVSASGEGEVKLFGANLRRQHLRKVPSERIKELQDKIQKIENEIRYSQNQRSLLLEKKEFLDSVRLFSQGQIPKDLVTKTPSTGELEDILKFLTSRLKENYSQIFKIEVKIDDLTSELNLLRRELSQISGPSRKIKRAIIVDLEVLEPGDFKLDISYLVRGAAWQPIYDARVDFDKGEVELVSYGVVKQRTGENWQNVKIYLSTAKPVVGGRMPYIEPWVVEPYQPPEAKVEPARRHAFQHTAFVSKVTLC